MLAYQINVSAPYITSLHFAISRSITSHYKGEHYEKLKQLTKGKHLWLRNNVATIICNCLENFLFYILAFYPTFSMAQILSMGLATCLLECVIGIADTPFLYLAKALKHGDESE